MRRSIGVVFQDFKLLEDRNIFENVALPLQVQGASRWEILEKSEDVLNKVGLYKKRFENPTHISGGEKQRVAIARALIHQPDFIIADEPTGNLDWRLSLDILDLFVSANKAGTTVLIATHDQDLVEKVEKRKLVKIADGKLFESEEKQPCGPYFKPLREVGLSIL